MTKNLSGTPQTVIVGMALNFPTFPSGDTTFMVFTDGTNTQCDLRISLLGAIKVYRNGTLLGTASSNLSANTWTYVEVKIKFDPSVGTVDLRLNGTSVLSLTAQNTRGTANSFASSVYFGWNISLSNLASNFTGGASDFNMRLDDMYILDGTGSADNAFWGDVRMIAQSPVKAGNYTQLTANGAGANYVAVADRMPDDDQSFVSGSTAGNKDTYGFETLPITSGTIKAAVLNLRARKDDAAAHTIGGLCRSGTTDSLAANTPALSSSYANNQFYFSTDPATSAAWTISGLNAAEFGPEVVS